MNRRALGVGATLWLGWLLGCSVIVGITDLPTGGDGGLSPNGGTCTLAPNLCAAGQTCVEHTTATGAITTDCVDPGSGSGGGSSSGGSSNASGSGSSSSGSSSSGSVVGRDASASSSGGGTPTGTCAKAFTCCSSILVSGTPLYPPRSGFCQMLTSGNNQASCQNFLSTFLSIQDAQDAGVSIPGACK
jgi:hypothetical protein